MTVAAQPGPAAPSWVRLRLPLRPHSPGSQNPRMPGLRAGAARACQSRFLAGCPAWGADMVAAAIQGGRSPEASGSRDSAKFGVGLHGDPGHYLAGEDQPGGVEIGSEVPTPDPCRKEARVRLVAADTRGAVNAGVLVVVVRTNYGSCELCAVARVPSGDRRSRASRLLGSSVSGSSTPQVTAMA